MLDGDSVGDRVAGLADDADGAHVGTALLQRQDDACREPAAADRDQHRVRVGRLLGELEADRALSGDDALVLEGVDERRARPLGVRLRGGDRIFEALSDELGGPAVRPRRLDLGHRRVLRHEDRRRDPGLARRPRDRLAVVAGTGGDDAGAALRLAEGRDGVVGAADLEGACPLEVLGLEIHLTTREPRERLGRVQRCHAGDPGEPLARGLDVSDRRRHRARTPPP